MIKHLEVSPESASSGAGIIGGDNWNEAHVHERGSLVPVSVVGLTYYAAGGVGMSGPYGAQLATDPAVSGAVLSLAADLSGVPVRAGDAARCVAVFSWTNPQITPAGWSLVGWHNDDGNIEVYFWDGTAFALPPSDLSLQITIYAEIVEAP